jgi:HAMP domain-containing protein
MNYPHITKDCKDNLIHYKDSNGLEYWKEYDSNNNLIHYKNSNGNEEWFAYDSNNYPIHYKNSDGVEEWYDSNGNSIKPKHSQAESMESISDTPRTDDEWDAITVSHPWDAAAEQMAQHARQLERELAEAKEYADKLAAGYPDGTLPKDIEVLRAANHGFAQEVHELQKQRDRLADALKSIASGAVYEDKCILIAREALQSLTTNSQAQPPKAD